MAEKRGTLVETTITVCQWVERSIGQWWSELVRERYDGGGVLGRSYAHYTHAVGMTFGGVAAMAPARVWAALGCCHHRPPASSAAVRSTVSVLGGGSCTHCSLFEHSTRWAAALRNAHPLAGAGIQGNAVDGLTDLQYLG